jgi:hypothetical protein
VVRGIFELEEHLPLDGDRFNQAGHGGSLAVWMSF